MQRSHEREEKMKKSTLLAALLGAAFSLGLGEAFAQYWQMNTQSYALKNGESVEISDLYYVMSCQSQLLSPPEVTIMDGPPGVTAAVTEAMVVPRYQQCSKPVKGGKLKITAEKVEEPSNSMMTLRVRFNTKDGVRDKSMSFSLALFP
jgi:hypothetical protein